MNDIAALTIHELAPRIESRELSPVDVVGECLRRIDELDPQLHSFVRYWPDEAVAAAEAAATEIADGGYRGPLHGIPVSIKDNLAVAGWPTTNGSALMADHITDFDATVVRKLREAGAIVVGKNNLHEWARGVNCTGGPFGTVHNPWDLTRVPGGSSGGSAAAVSASLVYGAVGTDGKGSIRIPASFCGVVGLKPTYGLVSRFGQLPPTSMLVDHVGPIAKDATDAAILLQAMAGDDPADPMSGSWTPIDYSAELTGRIEKVRVGVPENFFFDQSSAEVEAVVRAAIDVLVKLGAAVRPVRIPSLRHMHLVDAALLSESYGPVRRALAQGPKAFADETIWERAVVGSLVRTQDTVQAARLHNLIRREFVEVMEDVDLLAVPTTPTPAFPIDEPDVAPGESTREQSPVTALTLPHNISGMPAISLPCGFVAGGLPVALMLGGRFGEDHVVSQGAYAYEQATSGGYRPPPITSTVGGRSP